MEQDNFSENLRFACSQRHSVSQICRDIGLNRQQFNRYINGGAHPSPFNLGRIAQYFYIHPSDFKASNSVFKSRFLKAQQGNTSKDRINEGFPGDIRSLRRYLGYYQTYYLSPSWPETIVCSCAFLEEKNGLIISKSLERISHRQLNIKKITKYNGKATFLRDRIFLVETESTGDPIVTQIILKPFQDQNDKYLKGLCTGISWRSNDVPYATRMIWRHLGSFPDKREMLGRCGILPHSSRRIAPTVKKYLLPKDGESATVVVP